MNLLHCNRRSASRYHASRRNRLPRRSVPAGCASSTPRHSSLFADTTRSVPCTKQRRWLFTSLRLPILAPTGCGLTRCPLGTFDHGLVRDGIDGDRLLRQAGEELPSIAGPTPVEPKREFVEVVFQVLVAHRSLMSSQNPALQQRCDAVHARHQFRRGFLLTLQEGYVMCVASPFERIVADPPVG